ARQEDRDLDRQLRKDIAEQSSKDRRYLADALRTQRVEMKREQDLERDVQRARKDTQDVATLDRDLRTALSLIEKHKDGDLPGAGKWDSIKPDWLQSDDDTAMRQAAQRIANALLRELSGAAVTPQEAQRFMESRGMGEGATEARFKAGLTATAKELVERLRAREGKYRPEVLQELRARGGFTADQLPQVDGAGVVE